MILYDVSLFLSLLHYFHPRPQLAILHPTMAPCEVSSTVSATPETIWETCFVPMKWEEWDPDLNEVKEASGGCEDGTTCIFAMKDGNDIPITLSNVVANKSLTFSGGMLGGMIGAEGKVLITPVDAKTSTIDYR